MNPTPALAVSTEQQIEEHRKFWAKVAKENGWYKQPFFIQAWIDPDGEVADSVAYEGMTQDLFIDNIAGGVYAL